MLGGSNNLGFDLFPDPVGHFGFSRHFGIAGGERVPPLPLGWYFRSFSFLTVIFLLQANFFRPYWQFDLLHFDMDLPDTNFNTSYWCLAINVCMLMDVKTACQGCQGCPCIFFLIAFLKHFSINQLIKMDCNWCSTAFCTEYIWLSNEVCLYNFWHLQ